MTTKAVSGPELAPMADEAICCPPETPRVLARLTAPVHGPAADDELTAFAKAIAHPVRGKNQRARAK
jgi:hypothetical protein